MKDKTGTKLCKYCKSEMPASAKVCPNCRKKQGIKIWQILLIIVAIIVAFSLFTGEDPGPSSEGMVDGTRQEEHSEDNTFSMNEKIKYYDVTFVVTDVKKYKSKEYETAKNGYEYVEVFIDVENNSDKIYEGSSINWKMGNSKGQILEEAIVLFNGDNDLLSGSGLKKGGKASGSVVFEQPVGDKELEVLYYDNYFDEKETFKVKIK